MLVVDASPVIPAYEATVCPTGNSRYPAGLYLISGVTVSSKSHYEILQVHPDASPKVINAAYKSLSTKYHPDRDKSADAARPFAEIQHAFEVLSDPDGRRRYDANPGQGTAAKSESSVVFRVDGTSTFLTLAEHQRRGLEGGCTTSTKQQTEYHLTTSRWLDKIECRDIPMKCLRKDQR